METPPRSAGAVVLVAALVALAGCGAFPGGGSGSDSGDPSGGGLTPAAVPTDDGDIQSPVPQPGEYPPGIDADGIADWTALRTAHLAALGNRSYTVTRVRRTDGTTTVRTLAVESPDRYLLTAGTGANATGLTYADPTGTYVRQHSAGPDGRVTVGPNVSVADPEPVYGEVRRIDGANRLSFSDADVTRVERQGTMYYRLVMTDPPIEAARDWREYTATVFVRSDGLIKTIVVTGQRREGETGVRMGVGRVPSGGATDVDDWARVETRWTYRAIGNTSVAEPAWVRNATDARTPE